MNAADLLETLRNTRFLQNVDDEHLAQLAEVASLRHVPANAVVFREGQHDPNVYIVVSGEVALELRVPGQPAKRLHTVGKGELLGWSPVLEQVQMTATARALVDTQVIALDAAQILALCGHNPEFGYEFMRRTALALAKRLAATRLQLMDVYSSELPSGDLED
jgi:CRP-like cAMP-binding protein